METPLTVGDMLAELERLGIKPKGYDLESPRKRRRVFVSEDIHRQAMKLIGKAHEDGKWPLIVDDLARLKAANETAIKLRR